MINQLIEIIKTWHVLFQFFLLFGIAFMATIFSVSIIGYIGEFFTETLPVLFRGYPSNKRENTENDE